MTTTRERLLALRAKAHRHHVEFEKRKYNKKTVSKVVNATVALMALATAASGASEMHGANEEATIALATVLLIASIVTWPSPTPNATATCTAWATRGGATVPRRPSCSPETTSSGQRTRPKRSRTKPSSWSAGSRKRSPTRCCTTDKWN
ncbi:MAG: hypothetical protein OXG44_00185 [Gammaproteobacteria bacterium]|nr:hypothetical protein [Gammaproteobacteria bacterium]